MKSKKSVRIAVVSIAMVALALFLRSSFLHARETAKKNNCVALLRQIDGLKAAWGEEMKKAPSDVPTESDLFEFWRTKVMLHEWYHCPSGGIYTIGRLDQKPTCSVPDHKL